MNRKTLAIAIILFLTAAGCAKKAAPEDSIKKAVMDYLATRPGLNVASMDVTIASIAVKDDHAEADVKFQVKGGSPTSSMAIRYVLVREGGAWKVQAGPGGHPGSATGGASPHGEGGAPPMADGAGGADAGKAGAGPGFHPDTTKQ